MRVDGGSARPLAWRAAARAGALTVSLLAPFPAAAWCLLGCDATLDDAAAADALTALLGGPVPPGSEITGVHQGGFQDRFVLARMVTGATGRAQVIEALGASEADVSSEGASPFADGEAPFWDVGRATEFVAGALPGFPYAGAAFGEVDRRPVIWIWAFQT